MSDDTKNQSKTNTLPELVDDNIPEESSPSAKLQPNPKDSTIDQAASLNSSSPSVRGEQSVSGDMPDPESDDDTLANAQAMGFQVDEDTEDPKPLDMARDINLGEKKAHE